MLGASGVVVAIIFLGYITAQVHFSVLFGVIGAVTVILAIIIKLIKLVF